MKKCLGPLAFLFTMCNTKNISRAETEKQMTLTTDFNKTAAQKMLVALLDRAASRSSYGASDKQCWFLAKLIVDGCETEEQFDLEIGDWYQSNRTLSGKEASLLIDSYLNDKR